MARTSHFGRRQPPARAMAPAPFCTHRDDMGYASSTDRAARADEGLVTANIGLVHHIVRDVALRVPAHVSREDLLGAGLEGLTTAARTYDPARGVPFAAFAARRIRGAITDELRSVDWIGRRARTRARHAAVVTDELRVALGRRPSHAEVAARLGTTARKIEEAEALGASAPTSIDALPAAAAESAVVDDAPLDERLLRTERAQALAAAVGALPERVRYVVDGYFYAGRTMAELAEELRVTESRVSQLRAQALDMLRDGVNVQLDPEEVSLPKSAVLARRRADYLAAVTA